MLEKRRGNKVDGRFVTHRRAHRRWKSAPHSGLDEGLNRIRMIFLRLSIMKTSVRTKECCPERAVSVGCLIGNRQSWTTLGTYTRGNITKFRVIK